MSEVEAVFDLRERVFGKMHSFKVLSLIDVVKSDIKGDERVKI
mgnify:CR=1 FL=1